MLKRTKGAGAFWWTAAAALSGLIAVELTQDLPLTPAVIAAVNETGGDDLQPNQPPSVSVPSKALVDDIVDRPLFSPSRRPAGGAAVDSTPRADAVDGALTLALIGTMLVGDDPVALLRHPIDGLKRLRLEEHRMESSPR